ncbi:helix-turn-helix transcriptional regulator [Belliella sp. DSM 111904]|uniref:Helix-turn-helix transcriptional regulator n=1 Tax=Belliella filtrata TaxID=2923435 RepID=A0ABS9V4C7_9BACT|nr:helix-turn-helix transcriptional regulator [Belliella filtrata]MCH7411266.1 helix-turn-helix transcriptional regulator [Belliella filtrata]
MIDTNKIRRTRKQKGITQQYMASQLKMSQPVYARIERGQRRVTPETLEKIATILGENTEEFLDEEINGVRVMNKEFQVHSDSIFNQHFYPDKKSFYEEQIKHLQGLIEDMKKEKQELMDLLKAKMM